MYEHMTCMAAYEPYYTAADSLLDSEIASLCALQLTVTPHTASQDVHRLVPCLHKPTRRSAQQLLLMQPTNSVEQAPQREPRLVLWPCVTKAVVKDE